MAGLSTVFSVTRAASTTMASLTNESPSYPPPTGPRNAKKQMKIDRRSRGRNRPSRKQRPDKPSLVLIQRAIGAGSYRDSENGEMDQRNTLFDALLLGEVDKFEGPVEKKLRQIGEAFVAGTESGVRSSGKTFLVIAFKWILPIWTVSLLVACGLIKLPFSLPFLDDLIM